MTVEKNVQVEPKSNIWLMYQGAIVRATKQIAYTMVDTWILGPMK